MLLPFDQLCGSRLNYKLLHDAVRVISLLSIGLIFLIFFLVPYEVLRQSRLDEIGLNLFFYSPIVAVSTVVVDSFWLGRNDAEKRAVAIDWLFVLAYLVIWGFVVAKIIIPFSIF